MKRLRLGAVLVLAAAVPLAGCDWTTSSASSPPVGEGLKAVEPVSNLRSFGSERKLEAYLRVTVEGGFERLGRIDTVPEGSTYYWSGWTRGVFIGEDVYAVTPEAVRAAAVDGIGGAVWSAGLAQQ